MKRVVTGSKAVLKINGKPIGYATNVSYDPSTVYAQDLLSEFDIKFSNKYASRAGRMSDQWFADRGDSNRAYGSITKLCELLWKLGILKL